MKKVLFLYHTSSIGGGSYCLLNILKSIDRDRICPFVLLCNDGPLVNEIKKLGIDVNLLSSLRTVPYNTSTITLKSLANAIYIIQSMRALKRVIKRIKADVVYCNTMMLYPYLRSAKECGCKTIMHIREHWPENEHKWQRHSALNHIAKYADEIIAINRYSASLVVPYDRKATIVYDWIDMSKRYEYLPLSNIFDEDLTGKKVYMYMGGLQKIKGALQVIEAFTNHLHEDTSRLLVLGINPNYKSSGVKGCVKKCLKFINRESYSDRVIRMINTDSRIKCIPGVYNIRHLYEQTYCVLSYFTMPHANLALAESIISGTVSIAARTDESLEYSLEGNLALLFEENNFSDFIKKLKLIDNNRDEYIAKITENRDTITTLFDPNSNICKLNKVINSI